MKLFLPVAFVSVLVLFTSCSSDDTENNSTESSNYFPLTANTYWTYNNTNDLSGNSRDSLYVSGTETSNGNLYTNLDALSPADGFMTSFLSQSLLRKTNNQLLATGTFTFAFDGLPSIPIPIDEFSLYHTAEMGELSRIEGEVTQEFEQIPLLIEYTLTTLRRADVVDVTTNANALVVDLIINIKITAQIEVGNTTLPIPILRSQDVLVAQNHFAENIGLTQSNVSITYQLEDLAAYGITLPIPQEGANSSDQQVDTYEIAE